MKVEKGSVTSEVFIVTTLCTQENNHLFAMNVEKGSVTSKVFIVTTLCTQENNHLFAMNVAKEKHNRGCTGEQPFSCNH